MMNGASNIFDDVKMTWQGQEYSVPASNGMRLAYAVEPALIQDSGKSIFQVLANPPITTLAMAYGAALRFAGASVSDEEVLGAIANSLTGDAGELFMMQEFTATLLDMVLPPKSIRGAELGDAEKKTSGA